MATYGDTGKAYVRVPRHEFWRRNREKGLPDNYVMLVQDMYEGASTGAKTNVDSRWAHQVAEMRVLRWMR